MIVFAKLFQNIISPLPIFFICVILFVVFRKKRERQAYQLLIVSSLTLYILSNRVFANVILGWVESSYPVIEVSQCPETQVAIVLGGSLTPYLKGKKNLEENSGGRLVAAFRVYKEGKIHKLIVSGGNPYEDETGVLRTEAKDMEDYLVSLGVPKTDIIQEPNSRNTEENAFEVVKILKKQNWENPLLITSAFHMKRAVMFFRKNGVEVIPFPVAHRGAEDPRTWYLNLVPSPLSLDMSSQAIKEELGIIWGRLR